MRKFVENLHILLLVNSETLLRVAESKPGSGLGTRSQFNCTKTTGGRMQITSADCVAYVVLAEAWKSEQR